MADGSDWSAIFGDWEIGNDDAASVWGDEGGQGGLVNAAKKKAMVEMLAENGLMLKEVKPTKSRIFPLGFTSPAPVPAGASAVIIARPQVLFKGLRLVIPSDIAGDFTIDDLKVGKDSQFVAESSIPARILQEDAWGVLMQLDTTQIAQDVSIAVTNISGADRVFRAGLIGRVAET